MEMSMFLEYAWVLLVLIGLEGILAADNAVVMAVMVKHLPEKLQKKALFYGLLGAFIFRFAALFLITFLVNVWQIQAIGAAYLIFLAAHHLVKNRKANPVKVKKVKNGKSNSFWMTVLKVEIADIAFAIDSMLAAVALAVTLKPTGWFHVGGIDGGQFIVMLLGGLIGVVIMRFAATSFVKLLSKYPTLETAAFLIVGWVGVKLTIFTLAHPNVQVLNEHFPESAGWKMTFWIVLIGIAVGGYLISKKKEKAVFQESN
ncbi:TerC family protein [Lederbergia citrea]|uniref:TerC family protein n=1 Tax=Lederbergia citrea TaxID=2833581 RepID=A0A942UM35_9BACI|nr:TerC family protein [Lederbergia citrea]MBS4203990.1 TerC family protein [Lederbergia citrea]MBS4221426.1 TerC family protein [Lederbergia citrea]